MPRFRVQMAQTQYFDLYIDAETEDSAINSAMEYATDSDALYEMVRDNPFQVEYDDWKYNYSEELA